MPFYLQNIKLEENEKLIVYLNIVRELKNVELEVPIIIGKLGGVPKNLANIWLVQK